MPENDKTDADSIRHLYFAAAIAAVGGILFGYNMGVISGAILFIKKDFTLSSNGEEIVVSAVLLGSLLGAAAGGALADRLGRRRLMQITAIIFGIGAIGAATATGTVWLVVAQIVSGVASGFASFVGPLYISEIAPDKIRGRLVAFNQIALTSGIVISYLVDYAFARSGEWRWMFAMAVIPAIVYGVGLFFIPRSPRWLASHGQVEPARAALKRFRAPSQVEPELADIQKSAGQDKGSWGELLKPALRPAMIVGIGLAVAQQITGINTVIYYAPTIFKFAGFSSSSVAILASVGVGMINVVMTVVAMQLIDRVGRRPLLLISLAGMAVSVIVLGAAFALPQLGGSLGPIAVGSLMVYVGSFAIGLGPVFWLLLSEIYPLNVRAKAMSVSTSVNWAANLVVALSFLTLTQHLGKAATFWAYGLVTIGTWFFSYFLVPETKGKSLEQIEAHWSAGKHPRAL